MKKLIFLTVLLFGLVTQKSSAQSTSASLTNAWTSGYYLGWGTSHDLPFDINGSNYMTLTAGGLLGIGTASPNYLLDVNGGDIDVNSTTKGYRLGGTTSGWGYILWTNGDIGSLYAGIGAGNTSAYGTMNEFVGSYAAHSITSGSYNSVVGYEAGTSLTSANWNTIMGYKCGEYMQSGTANNYYGKAAGDYCNGNENAIFGSHAGFGGVLYTADSNAFFGNYSGYSLYSGSNNVYVGTNAGYASGNQTNALTSQDNVFIGDNSGKINIGGSYNITLGYGADAYTGTAGSPGNIINGVAIGAEAYVNHSNQFILGNNSQLVGIGMVGSANGPQANLEITTDNNPVAPVGPYPTSSGFLGYGTLAATNPYGGTGFSGLKFTDLTANSIPDGPSFAPFPTGVLSVDQYGNVIYIDAPIGIGYCSALTSMTNGGGYNLNSNNFYFAGNGSGLGTQNDVVIGNNCGYTPAAKVDILQASTANNTTALSVVNSDVSSGTPSAPIPLIGIESNIPNATVGTGYNVAGWFQSAPSSTGEYAIFVPQNGGQVCLGYPFATHTLNTTYELDVNGTVNASVAYHTSDSTLKTNVKSISNALSVIQKLQGVSFKFVDSVVRDSGMAGTHYGFIAQKVERVLPSVVKTNPANGRKALGYTEIIPWLVEGMKEQQQSIDSLKTVLASVQSSLSAIQHNQGNGSTSDSATITNVQDVTLSSSTGAPLLFQNIPNPFTTGTKINYYLPEGTMGATIVFYDTYGNQIKTIALSQTGNGTLNVTSDNLTNGIYAYSLIVNGSIIDTKKMMLQK